MAKYVTAGGKQRPVLFGWGAFMDFEERTDIDAFEMLGKWGSGDLKGVKIKHLVELFHCGFLNGCEDAGIEVDFTLKNVANWLSTPGLQIELTNLLSSQMPKSDDSEKGGNKEGEVKAVKKLK